MGDLVKEVGGGGRGGGFFIFQPFKLQEGL